MDAVFAALPLVAAVLAVPQFLPQLARARRSVDAAGVAGVSWTWAALTSVNNAAWLVYFALSGFLTALVPALAASALSGWLAGVLARRAGSVPTRATLLTAGWAIVLAASVVGFGRVGLGAALAVAFAVQVIPSVWTVYRCADTSGVALGTWAMIFGELACWGVFGLHEHDVRLVILGGTGVAASALVSGRVVATRRRRRPATHESAATPAARTLPAVTTATH